MENQNDFCVNALKGATFISTETREEINMRQLGSVNALKGAIFISTILAYNTGKSIDEMCQCPKRGDLHFYIL